MLVCVHSRARFHDVVGLLQARGCVHVGRASTATLYLDCNEVPCLTSRVHATISARTDGSLELTDERSTNGTFVRRGAPAEAPSDGAPADAQHMRRLGHDDAWVLRHGDVIGFGGPEEVAAGVDVADGFVDNPFLFEYVCPEARAPPRTPPPQGRKRAAPARCRSEDGAPARRRPRRGSVVAPARDADLCRHLECAICQDLLASALSLSCGHMFCGACVSGWFQNARPGQAASCPECRLPVLGAPAHCRAVDNLIDEVLLRAEGAEDRLSERRRKLAVWDAIKDAAPREWARGGLLRGAPPRPPQPAPPPPPRLPPAPPPHLAQAPPGSGRVDARSSQ